MNRVKRPARDLSWLRQISSFGPARIILTANNFRLFDHLEKGGVTAAAAARALGTDLRATEILLDALTAIGLLKKAGMRYANESVASRHLVSGKPGYQGDILSHYSSLWDNWSGLDRVLKTGKPNRVSRDHTSFIMGMHNIASLKMKGLLQAIPMAGVKRVLDLGGGPGTYAMAFAAQGLDVTLMDYPETLKIARRVIREAGLQGRVRLRPGDFTRDDIGSGYDLILVSQILHAYGAGECLGLLRRCREALVPGGRVAVHEFLLTETRTAPLPGAIFAVNMLVNTRAGRTYTAGEIASWLKRAGFHGIMTTPTEDTVVISGRKRPAHNEPAD